MRILLLEPFFTGSHAQWAEGYARHSTHQVELLTLPGRHWKWRMSNGALTLARLFLERTPQTDLLLATDMLDLPAFLGLTRSRTHHLPTALYFHENQITYPWNQEPPLERDRHYGLINFRSALCADAVFFNSNYHRETFLQALPGFLHIFPDKREKRLARSLEARCQVLPLGLDLQELDRFREDPLPGPPLILWNHRWEHDKNPEAFFQLLFALADKGLNFRVAVLGERYRQAPTIFERARTRLGERILHFGYADSREAYVRWLWRAHLLPVTSRHDFFGAAVVEALHCGCIPLLPHRLAYPEHLPDPEFEPLFYLTEDEALLKLERLLLHPPEPTLPEKLRRTVARYDWRLLARHYDQSFESLKGRA